ncbi:hypothetical protein [Bifidobacterium avesanii]|uniref:hypothetical protein n=1 Tax=Bifidobacterium avesanii TaxID=1798157 RepID=UPI0013863A43|nr:hypothetical protein DSM100685_1573 [Bifidobacterium avesanii]
MPAALRKARTASSSAPRAARSAFAVASAPNTGESARIASSAPGSSVARTKSRPHAETAATRRPELHVVQGRGKRRIDAEAVTDGFQRLIAWVVGRRSPFLTTVVAAVFLMGTLLGTLALRTQMVEYSFEAARVNKSIAMLTQDSQTYQSELDRLEAQLPQKATEMGMVPQQGTLSIDLQGYQPPADDASAQAAQTQNQGQQTQSQNQQQTTEGQ